MAALGTDAVLSLIQDVAADVVTPRFRSLAAGEVMEKKPGDLVTVADREAEALLIEALGAAYPDAVLLGEETFAADPSLLDRFLAADHAFTIDPIDGTKNFVAGSPDHAVMVAETLHGETVRGWIWQPEHRVAWVAERGAGVFRDGVRMHREPVPDGVAPVGATSMWTMRGHSLDGLSPMRLTWVCCGVDYPKLIEGEADYLVYSRSKAWDHAPGALMVTEAGGRVGHPDGTPYTPRSTRPGLVVAADPATYAAVQRRAQGAFEHR